MADAIQLLAEAARGAVEDITQPHEDYHAQLIDCFTQILHISHDEPNDRLAQRQIEDTITALATRVSAELEEIA